MRSAEADRGGVEGVVRVGQRQRVGPLEAQVASSDRAVDRGRLRARAVEHPLGEVAADHLAAGRHAPRELERQIAGAGGDVEHAAAGADARQIGGARAPAMVQAGGHRRVHQVIDARDAVEHRAHLARLQRPGVGARSRAGIASGHARRPT